MLSRLQYHFSKPCVLTALLTPWDLLVLAVVSVTLGYLTIYEPRNIDANHVYTTTDADGNPKTHFHSWEDIWIHVSWDKLKDTCDPMYFEKRLLHDNQLIRLPTSLPGRKGVGSHEIRYKMNAPMPLEEGRWEYHVTGVFNCNFLVDRLSLNRKPAIFYIEN